MKNSRLTRMVSLLVLVALLASIAGAACAPAAGPTATKQREDRVLTQAVADLGDGILDITATQSAGQGILGCMFDSFLDIDSNGMLAPGIITKWEIAPDMLSWTFNVRKDVIFHDGSKLTAKDVAFSFQYNSRADATEGSAWQKMIGNPVKTELIDDYALRLYTPTPQPSLPVFLSHLFKPKIFVVPQAYIEAKGEAYFRDHPIGSGNYKFVQRVAGDSMEFEAVDYPHWTGIVPDFNRLKILLVPEETTTVFMLQKGQIDVAAVGVEAASDLKQKGFRIESGSDMGTLVSLVGAYLPETKGLPISDVRVRQALSLAINRQEIVDTLLRGIGSVPASPPRSNYTNPDWTPATVAKWKPWFQNALRYDPAEARRLLTEAGYPNGFNFEFWVAPDAAAPYLSDLVTVLAGYWQEVGIKVSLIPVDGAAMSAARHTTKSKALIGKGGASATGMNRPISVESASYWTSSMGSSNLLVGSPLEAEVDALYKEGMATPVTSPRYAQILDRLMDIIGNSWTAFHVVASPSTFALGPRLSGKLTPAAIHLGDDLAKWKYTGK